MLSDLAGEIMKEFKPKLGDLIVIRNGSRAGEPFKIRKVTRITKTQIEVDGGAKFMLRSGKKIGEIGWYVDSLETWGEVTVADAIKRNKEWHAENDIKILRRNVIYHEWNKVSDEKMIRIKKILDEPENDDPIDPEIDHELPDAD